MRMATILKAEYARQYRWLQEILLQVCYLIVSYGKINSHDNQIYTTNEPSIRRKYSWLINSVETSGMLSPALI